MTANESASKVRVAPPRLEEPADDLAAVIFGSIDQGRNYAAKCTDANNGQ